MDEIKNKTLGIETPGESGRDEGLMSSNTRCLASPAQPSSLLESGHVNTPLRPTVAHREAPVCAPESRTSSFFSAMTFRSILK